MAPQKKILIGITGSIAATKSSSVIQGLLNKGHEVKCIITRNGEQFVEIDKLPLLRSDITLSKDEEGKKYLDKNQAIMEHIDLAKWADIILIAPASANMIAKLATGVADDLLSSTCLASEAKIMIAPAMNKVMWDKKPNRENLDKAYKQGIKILGPAYGEQACGDIGYGRMIEPEEILARVTEYTESEGMLKGKTVLITAGPTQEAIDPVRYITNHSSGKMGFTIAEALVEAGANVVLVSGPVSIPYPGKCRIEKVTTTKEMHKAAMTHIKKADIFIGCAAVCDYRVKSPSKKKIKKTQDKMLLELIKNPDILKDISEKYPDKFIVGFAAETNDLEKNALKKLQDKKLDIIIANDVSNSRIFGSDDSSITIFNKKDKGEEFTGSKTSLAHQIVKSITSNRD